MTVPEGCLLLQAGKQVRREREEIGEDGKGGWEDTRDFPGRGIVDLMGS